MAATDGSVLVPSAIQLLHIEPLAPSDSVRCHESHKSHAINSTTATTATTTMTMTTTTHPGASVRAPHSPEAWTRLQLADRMAWMTGFRGNKKGGVVFLDHETLKKQQGVFKEVMLQVGSQLLSGTLAVRISLPIRIFEPRSLLERVADGWNYAPTLLKKAALSTDPLERMKYTMAFVVGGFHFCIGQLKPFNPILGETYEAAYPDGTKIYVEHVAHHPVKSAFALMGPRDLYELTGVYEFESSTSRNSIFNHQIGTTKITFQNGQTITYTVPQIKMSGILFGERVVELTGIAKFVDTGNHLSGELDFDANSGFLTKSQADDIKGHIHATNKGAPKHAVSLIQGSWLTHLQCDGKVYWHVESEPAFEHHPVANPLPSDARFREDLIALKNGDLALAQSEKLRLEELQRQDRKMRESAATASAEPCR